MAHLTNFFFESVFFKFSEKMPLYFFYIMVQIVKNDRKLKSRGSYFLPYSDREYGISIFPSVHPPISPEALCHPQNTEYPSMTIKPLPQTFSFYNSTTESMAIRSQKWAVFQHVGLWKKMGRRTPGCHRGEEVFLKVTSLWLFFLRKSQRYFFNVENNSFELTRIFRIYLLTQ